MNKILLLSLILFTTLVASAHSTLKGKVTNKKSGEPIANMLIQIEESNISSLTGTDGRYELRGLAAGTYNLRISSIGYKSLHETLTIADNVTDNRDFIVDENPVELSEVTITSRKETSINTISAIDFKTRPYNTTQDLLRLVPGLFIAQHAGGGKAEQIFLRGFDIDHGTDIALNVDGIPVNMVSHAHGQGYSDLHFVIPETVEKINFTKGPYDARNGDFNTAGAVGFQTKNYLRNNMVKFEAGRFNTYRGVGMFNLLNNNDSTNRNHSAYVATEYFQSRGFFNSSQNFNRVNIFAKYTTDLNATTNLMASASAFTSGWDASGQIPERAVSAGLINRFGSIDNTEGGATSRYNANLILTKTLENDAIIKNQIFYTYYKFNLFSNFTFFNADSVNGDQIQQYEGRHILGYNGSYVKTYYIGSIGMKTTAGIGLRDDRIGEIGLDRTLRRSRLSTIRRGNVDETNFNAYLEESFLLSPLLSITVGVRLDHFRFRYQSALTDTLAQPVGKTIANPKFNLYFTPATNVQLYISSGTGFHSNDARVAATQPGLNTLPKAYGADLGTNLKIKQRLFVNAALWYLQLESEFVYVGDEGVIEPSGRSRRYGADFSARYQLYRSLYADFDLTYSHPRFLDEEDGNNLVPLAPVITNTGGLSLRPLKGINAGLRYRYLADRPAIEDNSIVAKGYFIMDAVLNYSTPKYQVGLTAENILNREWNEAQFATESKLRNETEPVTEIHFTPGTPFFIKGTLTYFF
ncbi:MAG TPA: TonB-dependent receptor [Cytophagaceae bacterium]